jgi:hypothetical protein
MSYTQNYALGAWHNPTGDLVVQHHAITGKPIAEAGDFDDYAAMGEYAARTGGAALRKMTFFERGLMLKQLALFLTERKERYYEVSAWTGATRGDSWIDIDGGRAGVGEAEQRGVAVELIGDVDLHSPRPGVPMQWWRSVGSTHTAFSTETVIDELAVAAGKDAVAFRQELLAKHPRHQAVLKLATDKAG